jgi:hypothetical protein
LRRGDAGTTCKRDGREERAKMPRTCPCFSREGQATYFNLFFASCSYVLQRAEWLLPMRLLREPPKISMRLQRRHAARSRRRCPSLQRHALATLAKSDTNCARGMLGQACCQLSSRFKICSATIFLILRVFLSHQTNHTDQQKSYLKKNRRTERIFQQPNRK